MAALQAGVPYSVPLRLTNRLCSSGLQAVADVAQGIRTGMYDVGLAVGFESMTRHHLAGGEPALLSLVQMVILRNGPEQRETRVTAL